MGWYFLNVWSCWVLPEHLIAGHKPNDYTIINAILLSLPHTPTWEVMKSNLLYHGPMLTHEAVSAELMSIYEQVTHEDSAVSKTLAFVSKGDNNLSGSKPNFKSTKGKMKKRWEPKPDNICHNCGKKGHWSLKCSNPKKSKTIGNAHVSITQSHEIGKVLMATDNGMPVGLLLNSAASCHMIANQLYFTKYCNIEGQHISVCKGIAHDMGLTHKARSTWRLVSKGGGKQAVKWASRSNKAG